MKDIASPPHDVPLLLRPEGRSRRLSYLLIIVLGVTVYAGSLGHSFHMDDFYDIVNNPGIFSYFGMRPTPGNQTSPYPVQRSVGYFTFAVNYHLNGLNVFGYHIVNLLIHLINAGLVQWLVLLTLASPALRAQTRARHAKFLSLAAALVFLLHPLQTETVIYIKQRLAELAALFYLLSICFFCQGAPGPGKGEAAKNVLWGGDPGRPAGDFHEGERVHPSGDGVPL